MTLKKLTLPLFLFFSIVNFAQKNQDIDNNYADYFNLSREIPYLHLNKTNFIEGEEIWFKAYVLDQKTQKLHQQTTNLYCTIYNEKGEYKQTKLLYVKNGVVAGNIKIDSTFTDNTYYIKASTNWMRNFKEDQSFIQKIHIVTNNKADKKLTSTNSNYDLQLLPEGGHLVESTNAVIGIIIKNRKNKGVQIKSGILIDDKNKVIKQISTNQFGLGKFSFFHKPNTNYKVKITTLDDEEIIKDIIPAKENGVTLSVENPNTTIVKLHLETNSKTLRQNIGKKYYIYIHNTNSISKNSFTFKKKTSSYNFYLSTKKIPKGTNIITILNENLKPILERVFFNYDKILFSKTNIKALTKSRDSISLQLQKNNDEIQYLSATFLPENTKSYTLENTMFSKFFLKPFVNGTIENSAYYFKNTNRKKLADLDLLLLNQGWSKYDWNNIFNDSPKVKFDFEKGITVRGTVISKTRKGSNVVLFSPQNNLIINAPIVNNKFSFNNIFLSDSSNVSFSIQGKKRLQKPKINTVFYPKFNKSDINISTNNLIKSTTDLNFEKFIANGILLEEIKIEKKTKPNRKTRITKLFANNRSFKKGDASYINNRSLISFLTTKGFVIQGTPPFETITNNRGISNFRENRGARTEVTLDYMPIVTQDINNLHLISHMTLDDLEEIIISKNDGGQIFLFSDFNKARTSRNLFEKAHKSIGFTKGKKYYKPNYYSTSNDIFKNYGAIYWAPNILLNKENLTLKMPHLNQDKIKVFIEGVTSNGSIIYEEKTITLNNL